MSVLPEVIAEDLAIVERFGESPFAGGHVAIEPGSRSYGTEHFGIPLRRFFLSLHEPWSFDLRVTVWETIRGIPFSVRVGVEFCAGIQEQLHIADIARGFLVTWAKHPLCEATPAALFDHLEESDRSLAAKAVAKLTPQFLAGFLPPWIRHEHRWDRQVRRLPPARFLRRRAEMCRFLRFWKVTLRALFGEWEEAPPLPTSPFGPLMAHYRSVVWLEQETPMLSIGDPVAIGEDDRARRAEQGELAIGRVVEVLNDGAVMVQMQMF